MGEEFDMFMAHLWGRIKEHYYQNNLSNINLEENIKTAIVYYFEALEKSVLKIKKGPEWAFGRVGPDFQLRPIRPRLSRSVKCPRPIPGFSDRSSLRFRTIRPPFMRN